MKLTIGLLFFTTVLTTVACTHAPDDTGSGSEDVTSAHEGACVPITTLECKPGYESTTIGCMQSHVAGATPLGHCVAMDGPPTDPCAPITTLECKAGYESTTIGCMQSHVAGATPLGHCVEEKPCVPADTLSCDPGYEPSLDGCMQSNMVGAPIYKRCKPTS